jgi:CheY-like chemotaxis protein
MEFARDIAAHLPYLRRYARALMANQKGGDRLVAHCLDVLVDDIGHLPGDMPLRIALYRLLHVLWSASALAERRPGSRHSPVMREALLLTAMEGFGPQEVAGILGIDVDDVNDLIDAAVDDFLTQKPRNILIVEDEAIIALDLKMIVEEVGHRVTHIARTQAEAVAAGLEQMPDLVLADVHLADGSSGIDAARELLQHAPVPVIFVTAYPERLLTGNRPEPAFVVTKPFAPATIKAAVWQAVGASSHADRVSAGRGLAAQPRAP